MNLNAYCDGVRMPFLTRTSLDVELESFNAVNCLYCECEIEFEDIL